MKELLLPSLLFAAAFGLNAENMKIAANFSDPDAYKPIPNNAFVSGALPDGWMDDSSWSKGRSAYSCEKEGGKAFLRIACPPGDKPRIQLCRFIEPFAERKAFRVVLTARSQTRSELRAQIQQIGNPRVFASISLRLDEGWKDYVETMAGGPADVKKLSLLLYSPGAGTIDIASLKLEEIPLSEHLPKTCVPSPRLDSKGWLDSFQSDCKRLSEVKPELIVMGDSITALWASQGKDAWERDIAPLKACRFGIGGDKIENLLWRVQHSPIGAEPQPKLVAILIGVNNLDSADAEDMEAGMRKLVAEIKLRAPEAKTLILGIFPVGEKANDFRRKLIKDANARYETIADGKSVYCLNFGDEFLEPDGSISKTTFFDFVHCTPKSYELYATRLSAKAKEIMGK